MSERNCNKCIHHTSGNCDSWNCNMQTVEDVKKEAVNEYVKAVVKELHENASRYTKKYVTPYGNNGYRDVKAISVNKAIKIVKQGGVSDDACEWKRDDMLHTVYKICGGCFTSVYQKDFKYCPYCGKKIKVVE